MSEATEPTVDVTDARVIPRQDHPISRKDICPYALKVLYHLMRNDYTAYLVGGGVRDLLLGRSPKDFDISTDAKPNQIKRLFRNCWLIGRRFRLAHIRYGDTVIETATFRRQPEPKPVVESEEGEEQPDLYVRDDNAFGTPREDAFRRDFTINGLFYDISSFSVIDYVGGLDDLKNRVVRCIGDPAIRFQEDPVRMLRAVRFAARLDFKLEKDTQAAILEHNADLAKAAKARLMEEVGRFFAFSSGEASLRLLERTGLLTYLLPSVAAYLEAANPRLRTRYFKYMKLLDRHSESTGTVDLPLTFATLLYPIWRNGRKVPKGLREPEGDVRDLTRTLGEAVSFPRKLREDVELILNAQLRLEGQKSRRFRRRKFASRDFFLNALTLYSFAVELEGADDAELKAWQDSYSALPVSQEETANQNSGRRRRRRGGRRNRRRSAESEHVENESVSTEEKNAEPEVVESESEVTEAAAPVDATQDASAEGSKRSSRRRRRRRKPKGNNSDESAPANEPDVSDASDSESVNPYAMRSRSDGEAPAADEEAPSHTSKRSSRKRRRRPSGKSHIRSYGRNDTPLILDETPPGPTPHWLDEI